jgi:hypothetical protein
MVIDPTDDQTFWYINEWVPVTSTTGWVVRIGSFKLASTVDTVTILKAQYSISGSKLNVTATDSNPAAVLNCQGDQFGSNPWDDADPGRR